MIEKNQRASLEGADVSRMTAARVNRCFHRKAVVVSQAISVIILQHVQDTIDASKSTRSKTPQLVASGLHPRHPLKYPTTFGTVILQKRING
ncbi:hypothetical protein TNCV_446481 [Trichonephila clavipes]|nr:hypothetical protein TNCV_446481 [Trichonephila clavipes]